MTGARSAALRLRALFSIPVVWAALCVALFLASGGVWERVGSRDLHAIYVPKYEAAARAWGELRLPLWNPFERAGMPLLGIGHAAALYPPVMLAFFALPPRPALELVYAFHIALLALATTALARDEASGPAIGLAPLVALTGIFTTLGGIDHPAHQAGAAWFAVLLLCQARANRSGSTRWLAALALAAAAQWLTGYPDFGLDSAVLLGIVALVDGGAPLARRLRVVVIGLGLGAALAAVQLVPLAETVAESARPLRTESYAALRHALFSIGALVHLARSSWEVVLLPALVLAALGLALRRSRARLAWGAAFLFATFAVTPPLSLLYELFPFSRVRFPFGWTSLAPVLLGLLAAVGTADAVAARVRVVRAAGRVLAATAVAVAAIAIVRAPGLLPGAAPSLSAAQSDAATLADAVGRGDPSARVVAQSLFESGGALRHRLRSPAGFERAVPPRRMSDVLALVGLDVQVDRETWRRLVARPDLAALLGVGAIVAPASALPEIERGGFRKEGDTPSEVVLYRPPWPRPHTVHRVIAVDDDAAALARLADDAGSLRDAALVDRAVAERIALAEPPAGSEESVAITVDEPERIELDVKVASAALLVVADTHFPGWWASVDGVPVEILRADHAFRAVALPPGSHRVAFRYAPRSLAVGAATSAGATIVLAALLLRERVSRRSPTTRAWAPATSAAAGARARGSGRGSGACGRRS